MPALTPVGTPSLPARTVLRIRPLSETTALQRVQDDRANTEAELAALRSDADPRYAGLRIEAEGLERIEEDVVSRRTRLWDVLLGMEGLGPSARASVRASERVRGALEQQGFRFCSSDFRARELIEGSRPGSDPARDLFHTMPEEGAAALLPLWEDQLAEPQGVLVGLHARHGTPQIVNRFAHPSHSSAIFGETGSGKSYASALGWLRLRWFHPDLSIFVLDPLGGLARVVGALGGRVLVVGDGTLALNPLDPATTGGDPRTKTTQVGVMFRALFPSLSDEEVATLDTTLYRLFSSGRPGSAPPLLRDLARALEQLRPRPDRLLQLLGRATLGSLRGLDRPTSIDVCAQVLGFDLSRVTATELPFFLTLLLDLVYAEIRRRPGPKLVVLDEAHYLARSPATATFLDHLVRHVRHYRAGLELLSQDPEDFLRDETGRAILSNLDHLLLLHLKDGGAKLAPTLDLSTEELDFVRRAALPGRAGYSEALFVSSIARLPLAVVSSDAEHELLEGAFRTEGQPSREDRVTVGALADATTAPART